MAAFLRFATDCKRMIVITLTSIKCVFAFMAIFTVMAFASDDARHCCPPTSQEHQMRHKSTTYQPDSVGYLALSGSIYRNQTVTSRLKCASACLREDSCKSFNYCKYDKICQLNSAVESNNKTALQPSSRCVYYKEVFQDAWKDPPRQIIGSLKHVSIGGAGVWGVDSLSLIYYRGWCGCSWTEIPGLLKQLDVGNNVVWAVNNGGQIFYRGVSASDPDGTSWTIVSGELKHVSVSQKGHVWGVNRNDMIYHRMGANVNNLAGSTWFKITGSLKQISVGSGGVWGVDSSNKIFYRVGTYGDPDMDPHGSSWVPSSVEAGSTVISPKYVSSGDAIYVIDTNDAIYYRVGTSADTPIGTVWQEIKGKLTQIESVSRTFWGVDADYDIYTNDSY